MEIEIKAKDIRLVPIEDIKENPENRNKHGDDQIARLCKIIEYQGFRSPLIVSNRTGILVSGHGRIQACRRMGIKHVPVLFQDFDSADQEYAAGVSENSIASWAELDLAGINADLPAMGPDFNIDFLGIKNFTLDVAEKLEPQCDEDEVPEHVEPRTKLGDIYKLGRHRLMCGDSTSIDAVEKLMDGAKADMVFTDPPYGISIGEVTKRKDTGMKLSDGRAFKRNKYRESEWDKQILDPKIYLHIFSDIEEVYLWGANNYANLLPPGYENGWMVWDKRTSKENDRKNGSDFEICWSKKIHGLKIFSYPWIGPFGHNKKNDGASRVHPTQKPVAVALWFFERWAKPDGTVVDLFGGSGTTLIASEKTNRKCLMMEMDAFYCDVIVARWEKYTGQKAELIAPN